MLYACHSLYQNLYAWIRIGSRGSIGVSSHPAQEGSRRLLSSHALARPFSGRGDLGRSSAPIAKERTAAENAGPDIPDREHGLRYTERKPGAKMGIRDMLSRRPGQTTLRSERNNRKLCLD